MFIAHGEKFRKNARWIMTAVLLLLIPGFIFLFTTTTQSERRAAGDRPSIAGKPVDSAEYQDSRNAVMQLITLNTGREPRRTPEMENQITQQAVVRMLIMRKAKEFGIRVSDTEVVRAIQSQPILLNEAGQFDPDRFRRFTIYLNQIGISEARYEDLIRSQLTRDRLEQFVTAAAMASSQEVALTYAPLHEPVTIEMAQFVADYKQPLTVSNEEAQVFYEQNKETYRTPAQAKIRYAHFSIETAKKSIKLTDEEIAEFYERSKPRYMGTNAVAPPLETVKTEVENDLRTLRADRAAGDRATEFSIQIVPRPGAARPDFGAVCKEFGVTPVATDFFSQLERPIGETGGVAFVQQAFALNPDAPTSDPVTGPDGYYVLEYLDSKPSVIPPFEEVKDKVVDQIKRTRIYEATVRRGQETVAELKKLVATGKTFTEACAELKLKVETPPPFHLADEKTDLPAAQRIQIESLSMPVGAVSEFIPTMTGGVVFHVKDRQPPDPAAAEKDKAEWTQRVLNKNRQALFQAWLGHLIREQQVDFGRRRSLPTEVELPEETS